MLATSALLATAFSVLGASDEAGKFPLSVTGSVVERRYCVDRADEGIAALHLTFRLVLANSGRRPLIVSKLIAGPFAWDVARTVRDASAGRFVDQITDTFRIFDEPGFPPAVRRGEVPDAEQFSVLGPGERAAVEVSCVLSVARSPRDARPPRLKLGEEYVVRLFVNLWPYLEEEGDIESLWRDFGTLAYGEIGTDFIPFSTPWVKEFPECQRGDASPRE